jgi:membrane protein YqaA with SNARE-associated domain
MDPKLRSYLESLGLRAEATEEDARAFMGALGGTHRQICDVLDRKAEDETARNMQRLSLQALGVNPDEPWKRLEQEPDPPPAGGTERTEGNDPPPPVDEAAIRQQATADERTRQEMIRRVVGDDGDEDFIQRAVSEGWDEERVNTEVLGLIRNNRAPAVGGVHSRSQETNRNARSLAAGVLIGQNLDPTRHAMFNDTGLPSRQDHLTEQDADRGHSLRAISLPDLFRECVELDTGRRYRTIDEALLASRASVSGGTLAYIFGTNVYARLIAGWETVGDTTQGWCDEEDVPNFLQQEDITFDGQARMDRLPRGDTAKHATVSDTHETYKIARYAKQFVMDEQDIIDDRLGALMKMPQELGEAARRVRPDFVYSLMLENPSLVADTTAVYDSATHGNLGTGVLSEANLKVGIQAMGTQRDSESNVINVVPTHLIVPPDLQWTARELTKHQTLIKLFADSSDPMYSTVNQLAEIGLTPVMDARIDATGVVDPRTKATRTGSATNWFLATANSRSIRVAYRRGTGRVPSMRSFVLDKGQWGLGWDINLDIGAAFMDYRGWYKSTGAV